MAFWLFDAKLLHEPILLTARWSLSNKQIFHKDDIFPSKKMHLKLQPLFGYGYFEIFVSFNYSTQFELIWWKGKIK